MTTPTPTQSEAAVTAQAETPPSGIAALGINGQFLAAQIVNFLLLFAVLRWVLYRPIVDVLRQRRTTIEESLKQAAAAEAAAERAAADTKQQLDAARQQAKQIVFEAKQQAEQIATELTGKAAAEAAELLTRTRAQLDLEKTAIVTEAKDQLAELVILATERVLSGQEIDVQPADVAAAIHAVQQHD